MGENKTNMDELIIEELYKAHILANKLHLSVDMRKDKPFHCDICKDTYEPCKHWSEE